MQAPRHPSAKHINKGELGVAETSLEAIRSSQVDMGNGRSFLSMSWRKTVNDLKGRFSQNSESLLFYCSPKNLKKGTQGCSTSYIGEAVVCGSTRADCISCGGG